jgi:hypothetical protein
MESAGQKVSGEVRVTNLPLDGGRVSVVLPAGGGGLTDSELRATPIEVTGSLAIEPVAVQEVSGNVSVSGSVGITGDVTVANFPQTQAVSISGNVPVTGTFWQATQPVSGTFWQATQPISGNVGVSNFPASQAVTGTFWQATQPVSIAAVVKAREDTSVMTWASVKSAAPTANAVQATTGALAAGNYDFDINLACADTVAVGKGLVVEHRNAADNATLQNLGACTPNGGAVVIQLRNYPIATNERIRVIAGTAAGAASSMYVSAIGRRIS